ncbi:MAG: nucleoside 2-deoxyribosyltransferase [Chloroflexi bacterium]|nr:nucleoside 2-deoxyribosyltransferase [Chloroflexota bacterium]
MNIYFACSITGGREFESVYQMFVSALAADGHEIPTFGLAQPGVTDEAHLEPVFVYERDTAWIRGCDALIAEVSVPSHGVGYEVGYALALEKPVLCLAREGRMVSKMITGNQHPLLWVKFYPGVEEGVACARDFLSSLKL